MKRIGLKGLTLSMVALLALTLNSCKKEVTPQPETKKHVATDPNATLRNVNGVFNLTMEFAQGMVNSGTFKTAAIASCADITVDSSSSPRTATINFGSGCMADNGKFYSGMVYLEYTDLKSLREPGSMLHVTFTNFMLDSTELDGTFNLDNNGLNLAGNLVFDINMNLSIADLEDNENMSLDGNFAYEFSAGQATETDEDDQLSLTGQVQGTTPASTTITLTILDPVVSSRAIGCDEYYIAGEIQLQETGQPDRFINYGSGTCDDQAVETVNGNSNSITLDGGFQ